MIYTINNNLTLILLINSQTFTFFFLLPPFYFPINFLISSISFSCSCRSSLYLTLLLECALSSLTFCVTSSSYCALEERISLSKLSVWVTARCKSRERLASTSLRLLASLSGSSWSWSSSTSTSAAVRFYGRVLEGRGAETISWGWGFCAGWGFTRTLCLVVTFKAVRSSAARGVTGADFGFSKMKAWSGINSRKGVKRIE